MFKYENNNNKNNVIGKSLQNNIMQKMRILIYYNIGLLFLKSVIDTRITNDKILKEHKTYTFSVKKLALITLLVFIDLQTS